ncbi:hypothetical protein Glove_34g54 [Diversispora epigaea]|uniref:HTH CENPB-type domain-containing protein n=1 Tax=Diversispora epigaea TaxID=1348612 RepID=A0A397JRD0_9GLOM|nr:hypothetical protein Glove_34g54 [Diversispora epigaea]
MTIHVPKIDFGFLSSKYNLNIERSTITKILSQQKKWFLSDASLIVKHPIAGGIILSDDILQEKERDFANYLNIEEDQINFSRGWVTGFKKRNFIRIYKLHVNERLKLQELISKYNPEDIYNADKTGLFFRMAPNQTLANRSRAEKKLDKSRITVLFTTNAIGTHKLKPLTWMRSNIWETWLKYHNKGFQIQNCQVLLLVNNAPSHTSSIIDENNINKSDSDTNSIQESSKLTNIDHEKNKINVKEAIGYVAHSFLLLVNNAPSHTSSIIDENNINKSDSDTNSIQESSKLRILPNLINNSDSAEELFEENIKLTNFLYEKSSEENIIHQKLINEIETYINAIDEPLLTEDILSKSEIITMVVADNEIENNLSPDSEEETEELPLSSVTSKETLNVLKILIRYEEQLSDNDNYNKVSSNDLCKRLSLYERRCEKNKKQVSLEHIWIN